MKFIRFFTLMIILITSCSRAQSERTDLTATPTIKTTQTTSETTLKPVTDVPSETPANTPTPIDISGLDLKLVLDQLGAPTVEITAGQITDTLPAMYNGIEQPLEQVFQEITKDDQPIGGIVILISGSWSDATANYAILLQHMGWKGNTVEVKDLGNTIEEARISPPGSMMAGGIRVMDLVFQRCSALVQIHITGDVDREGVISYAKQLDKLLLPLICP